MLTLRSHSISIDYTNILGGSAKSMSRTVFCLGKSLLISKTKWMFFWAILNTVILLKRNLKNNVCMLMHPGCHYTHILDASPRGWSRPNQNRWIAQTKTQGEAPQSQVCFCLNPIDTSVYPINIHKSFSFQSKKTHNFAISWGPWFTLALLHPGLHRNAKAQESNLSSVICLCRSQCSTALLAAFSTSGRTPGLPGTDFCVFFVWLM